MKSNITPAAKDQSHTPAPGAPQIKPNGSAAEATPSATAGGLPAFPEIAWRGLFGDYRDAMQGSTEASDVAHFATFWAAVAVRLGREIHMYSGSRVYPNAFIAFHGPTGDKKTTAQRRINKDECHLLEHAPQIGLVDSGGSAEGLATALAKISSGCYLLIFEEFATILAMMRWPNSTLPTFFTVTYDCPDKFDREFRKNPIHIVAPTPSILAMTTPEWFWLHAEPDDFFGGALNRFFFLAGAKKEPIPNPNPFNQERIRRIKTQIEDRCSALPFPSDHPDRRARWTPNAQDLWNRYYRKTATTEHKGLLAAALKRHHIYIRKLGMVYAFIEGTFPEITAEQLLAAIAVSSYSAQCTRQLLEMQGQSPESDRRREQELRCIEWLKKHPGQQRLRNMQQKICHRKGDSEMFNRIIQSLERTDQIIITREQGKIFVTPSRD
jgi:hypothetical protein